MFEPSTLLEKLLGSKTQATNSLLYQTIKGLIDGLGELNSKTSTIIEQQGTTSSLPSIAKGTLLGRRSTSPGTAEQISLGPNLSMVNTTLNSLDYVVLSDGANPPNPVNDGAGNFIYVAYTP